MWYDVVQNIGVVGLVVFALEFPRAVRNPVARARAEELAPRSFSSSRL